MTDHINHYTYKHDPHVVTFATIISGCGGPALITNQLNQLQLQAANALKAVDHSSPDFVRVVMQQLNIGCRAAEEIVQRVQSFRLDSRLRCYRCGLLMEKAGKHHVCMKCGTTS